RGREVRLRDAGLCLKVVDRVRAALLRGLAPSKARYEILGRRVRREQDQQFCPQELDQRRRQGPLAEVQGALDRFDEDWIELRYVELGRFVIHGCLSRRAPRCLGVECLRRTRDRSSRPHFFWDAHGSTISCRGVRDGPATGGLITGAQGSTIPWPGWRWAGF